MNRFSDSINFEELITENKFNNLWLKHSKLMYSNEFKILYVTMNEYEYQCADSLIMNQTYFICLTYSDIIDENQKNNVKIKKNNIHIIKSNNKKTMHFYKIYLYYPKSTWSQGRNALILATIAMELYVGFKFNYVIFTDGDIKFKKLNNVMCDS